MRKLVRFSSILLLAAVLFSCKHNTSYEESESQGISGQQAEKQADKADDYVTVNLSVNKSAREAFVPDEDSGKNYSFDLTGYLDGSKELKNIWHWDNFDAISGSEFQIKRGNWELILTASAGDYNDYTKEYTVYPVLKGTCTKNITKAETIPFTLEKIADSEAPGEYFMYLHFPKSENWAISASIKDLATLSSLEDEYYNPILKKDSDEFAEIHGKLPAGEYKLGVKFVYKSGSLEMTSVVPIFIVIAPGCQTHGDIFLDSEKLNVAHPIYYADYDAVKGNYSLPEGFPTVFTSYASEDLPTPTRTDSDNYAFVGWFTDGGFRSDSKLVKTPLYTDNGEFELVLYPKWVAKTSPYFSLEDKEGINFVLSDDCKALFENGKATSMQYFVKNTETGFELNAWFDKAAVIEMNYEWNYPFVNNGTDYEAYLNIGDVTVTERLGITPETGIGEDEHFYDEADFELDENGILHITNIPEYIDYENDESFKEQYIIAIWEGAGWDDSPIWRDNNVWDDFQKTSLDFDLTPWLDEHRLYGKPFMTLCSRDYWYKGKKYSMGFGSPVFTYGDLDHVYFYDSYGEFLENNWGVRYFDVKRVDTVTPVEIKEDSITFTFSKDIPDDGSSKENIQVVQTALRMEDGKRYKVSYKVKAPEGSISSMLWDDKTSVSLSNGSGCNSLENTEEEMMVTTYDPIKDGPKNVTILFFPRKKGTYSITDLTVTEAESVTVKFMNGDEVWETVVTYEGMGTENGLSVEKPYKSGYTFTGWYSDTELTTKVNYITKDTTTLYAGFEVEKNDKPQENSGTENSGTESNMTTTTYYSCEAATKTVTYLFDSKGTLTGKKDSSGNDATIEDGDQTAADLLFIKFVVCNNGLYTSLIMGGTETVVSGSDLASYYTWEYDKTDETITLSAAGSTALTVSTDKNGNLIATMDSVTYKFDSPDSVTVTPEP